MDITKVQNWLDEDESLSDVNENSSQSSDKPTYEYYELQNVPTTSYNVSDELQNIHSHDTTQFSDKNFSDFMPSSSESISDQLSDSSQYDSINSINIVATLTIQSRSHARGIGRGMSRRFRGRTIHTNNLPSYSTYINQNLQNNTLVFNNDGININWMDIRHIWSKI